MFNIIENIGIRLKTLLKFIAKPFGFQDIYYTHEYLNIFYELLIPIGVRGISIIQHRYKEILINITDNSQSLFEDTIKALGGKDKTLEEMRSSSESILNKKTHSDSFNTSSWESKEPMNADGRTLFFMIEL